VLLGNSDKGLYSQITSDALKHNNFTLNNEKKEIVGFKINDYTPLSHRVLKEIDKLKHLAEKKRLLYVALTRAEHDVVISANLKQKKDGAISLREDSYLHMMCQALEIDSDELYGQNKSYCIGLEDSSSEDAPRQKLEYIQHTLEPISFETNTLVSATSSADTTSNDNIAAKLGTVTHKIIELYWSTFSKNQNDILDKMMIYEPSQRKSIIENMDNFYGSDVYELLKSGVEHHFELEFTVDEKTGFIDFIYFDKENKGWVIVDFKTGRETQDKNSKYQEQLNFYQDVLESLGYEVWQTKLLWLSCANHNYY